MHSMRDMIRCLEGSAAAEMALVTPLLLTLLFGSFELGNYFLDNHVVEKAVRDGARYAARQSLSNFPCSAASTGSVPLGTVVSNTQNLVRTGAISGGTERLNGWNDPATIVVSYNCITASSASVSYSGIYKGMSFVPVVTVKINQNTPRLMYNSLFGILGFNSSSLSLNASSQASVTGI